MAWLQPRTGPAGVLEFFQLIGSMNIKDFQVLSVMAGGNQVAVEFVIEVAGAARHEQYHHHRQLRLLALVICPSRVGTLLLLPAELQQRRNLRGWCWIESNKSSRVRFALIRQEQVGFAQVVLST